MTDIERSLLDRWVAFLRLQEERAALYGTPADVLAALRKQWPMEEPEYQGRRERKLPCVFADPK